VEETGKIAGAIIACLSVASTIFGIVLLRWIYISVNVKTLRDEIGYLSREVERKNKEIQEKDKELAGLRSEFSHWKQKVLEVQKLLADVQQKLIRRSAQILSMREYNERLEAVVLDLGGKLPKKDRVNWEEEA
jgi:chromosome segregation ATPase